MPVRPMPHGFTRPHGARLESVDRVSLPELASLGLPRVQFIVPGRALAAGNKTAYPFRRRDGSLGVSVAEAKSPERRKAAAAWRALVTMVAEDAMRRLDFAPFDCAVRLDIRVVFVRPAGHFNASGALNKKGRETPFPSVKPDWDKLARSIGDSLKGVAWTDDSRVCDALVSKRYGARDEVRIEVSPVEHNA